MTPHATVDHKPVVELSLKLNIENNRAKAHLSACCKDANPAHLPCQDFLYYFNKLKIDREKKVISFKDQVIAKYGAPSQKAVMQSPFILKYEVDSKTVDMGGEYPEEIQQ